MKLNIGSGLRPLKKQGWVDVDIRDDIGADIVADAKELPLENGVVDEILAHSVLEHFSKREFPSYLREWNRVLKKGGVLKISVPDMARIGEKLKDHAWKNEQDIYNYINFIYGEQDYPENFHKWGWTEKSLREDLKRFGFRHFERLENTRYFCELFIKVKKEYEIL